MRGALLLLTAALTAAPVAAQVPYSGCVDRAGVQITAMVDRSIPAGAQATRVDNKPVIYWNQGNMQWAAPVTQLFVYLHECGHHALGHLYKQNDKRWEREADCWAMQMLVDGGMIDGTDEMRLVRELERSFPGDDVHLSGEATVRDTRACIAARTDPKAWKTSLDSLVAAVPDTLKELVGQRMFDVPELRFESLLDLPGTFDCELSAQHVFRCPVYSSPSARRAKRQYEDLVKILRGWLPSSWSAIEGAGREYVVRQFTAEDGMTGARITLALTDHSTVFFIFQPVTS